MIAVLRLKEVESVEEDPRRLLIRDVPWQDRPAFMKG